MTYDRNFGDGDEVSIGVEWSGLAAAVSISRAQQWEPFQRSSKKLAIFWNLSFKIIILLKFGVKGDGKCEKNAGLLFACSKDLL